MQLNKPDQSFQVGVKIRLFNWPLEQAIKRKNLTLQQAADTFGISIQTLYAYLSFRSYPRDEDRKLRIAITLEVSPDAIFPEHLANVRLKRQPEPFALSATDVLSLNEKSLIQPDITPENFGLREILEEKIATLKPREAYILKLRFGLGENGEDTGGMTLDAVGREVGLSRERVRNIESRALKKLRSPEQSKALLAYFKGDAP